MIHDPETEYRVAQGRREEQVQRARWRHELYEAGIATGPRGALAGALRELADRVDDTPGEPAPPVRRREPAT